MGGRRTSSKFDEERYAQMMVERIRTDLILRGYAFGKDAESQRRDEKR
jgi:hypothetical protein